MFQGTQKSQSYFSRAHGCEITINNFSCFDPLINNHEFVKFQCSIVTFIRMLAIRPPLSSLLDLKLISMGLTTTYTVHFSLQRRSRTSLKGWGGD